MSHTKLSELPFILKFLRKIIGKDRICIDTEGAQIRTTKVKKKILIQKSKILNVFNNNNFSTKMEFLSILTLIF